MASPEYKKEVVASATDREWFGGDTLQAAIGQSYSLFTPIQLATMPQQSQTAVQDIK